MPDVSYVPAFSDSHVLLPVDHVTCHLASGHVPAACAHVIRTTMCSSKYEANLHKKPYRQRSQSKLLLLLSFSQNPRGPDEQLPPSLQIAKCCLQLVQTILRQEPEDPGAPQFLALSAFGLFMVILPSPCSWLTSKVSSTLEVLNFWHVAFENADVKRMLESDLGSDVTSKKRLRVIAERADPIAILLFPHSCKL